MKKRQLLLPSLSALFWVLGISMAFLQPMPSFQGAVGAVFQRHVSAARLSEGLLETFAILLANNIIAASLILLGGLATGGLLAAAGLIWNGLLLGAVVRDVLASNIPHTILAFSLILHGPLELTGFLWIGAIGLRGAIIAVDILRTGRLEVGLLPSKRELWIPFLLIIIAAYVEALISIGFNGYHGF